MEKLTEETAVDLMQLMLDEEWVREAVRIEEEAEYDIGVVTSPFSICSRTAIDNVLSRVNSTARDIEK